MHSTNQPIPAEAVESRIAAIVLAAGYSSRMADFKPLLPLAGSTALERCIGLFRAAGVAEVIAVLGHRAEELQPLAEHAGARCVLNPRFEQGMFSSISIGSRALAGRVEAAFVLPVDIPLVRPNTIRQMSSVFVTRRDGIVYPVFEGRRGHPPLIARKILSEAAEEGVVGPLFDLLARHENEAINLLVADHGIHMDMNTPAEYETLCALADHRDIPTRAECEAILTGQSVVPSQVRHSRRVAEVAERITLALARSGLLLNVELVRAGALLHDLAKGQPNHAVVGAELLRSMDFPRVATVVGVHTDLDFSGGRLDESAIVSLADKLVRGENVVTLDQRFQPALARFSNNPPALHAAQSRMATAKAVALAVESRLGASLSSIVNETGKP
ncbi:MAG: DVU_1551 family NTP transferase [Terracidiphilus sp.]|jgi:putative nucleotidyltransferase with HDIG domain